MKRFSRRTLCLLLAVVMLCGLSMPTAFAAESKYSDIAGHWAEEAIQCWSDYGIIQGSDGKFDPNGNMTRAQAATVFAKLLKLQKAADISAYTDVKADAWYADALAKCYAAGILKGVADDKLNPEGSITREMFFVMFARAMGIEPENELKVQISDLSKTSDWAVGYINALVNNGWVNGVDSSKDGVVVAPDKNINRASAVSVLNQTIAAYVYEENDSVTVDRKGIVLVVAQNATVKCNANNTVVITADGAKISLSGSIGDIKVLVNANDVKISNAPAGTVVISADGVSGLVVNNRPVSGSTGITVGGSSGSGSSGDSGSSGGSGGSGDSGDSGDSGGDVNPDPDPGPDNPSGNVSPES